MKNLSEKLRPLVGLNAWDYCVHWKLSKDRRFLFWEGCSCAGTESSKNGGDKLPFTLSSGAPCRDTMSHHPRTESCALLSQLPLFKTLDSGIHVETLSSNQSKWLSYTNSLGSNTSEKTVGTQVLIPVPGGIVELFATKQLIDFVTCCCNLEVEWTESKNFEADIKRRERLNRNLSRLRSLVPIISGQDKASIIGDTIEYVNDLQKQVKQLQEEFLQLEKISEVDEQEAPENVVGVQMGPKTHQINTQKKEFDAPHNKQQKEAQVEVAEIKGNGLHVKVLFEHRTGGFVKLMGTFHSLGLHVIRAKVVTSQQGLVSNVFKVQREEINEVVKAEEIRASLVEVMRKACGGRNSHNMSSSRKAKAIQNGRTSISMLSLCLLLPFIFLSL